VEPETPDLLPGELAGRLLSLLKPQDVIEVNSAVRPDRRVGQLPTVAEVHDVLSGRTQDRSCTASGDQFSFGGIWLSIGPGHTLYSTTKHKKHNIQLSGAHDGRPRVPKAGWQMLLD
jgi:hypothetical protein